MNSLDDSSSEDCETNTSASNGVVLIDELPVLVNEVVDDFTSEKTDGVANGDQIPDEELIDDGVPVVKARTYQLEMLDESLKQNVIIAMDTGSGKTHIAVMRMIYELEKSPFHQSIWFAAPTVSLCEQQYEYIKAQITSVKVKFLSGADNVERWTNQLHWDEVLKNVRIVVSPYQILLEALSHGFVQMDNLAMIVFDEAHNCVGKYPGALLMWNFYRERKAKGLQVPKILGLTASPVMRSDTDSVKNIEKTLDAMCRTPKKHRSELRIHVTLPAMIQVEFHTPPMTSTGCLSSLTKALRSMNLTEDPYYISLKKDRSDRAQRSLQKLIMNQKTWSRDTIKSFSIVSQRISEELGIWAVDYYISHVVSKVRKLVRGSFDNQLGVWDVSSAEKEYVAKVLGDVQTVDVSAKDCVMNVTDKVNKLIDVLLEGSTKSSGIIFVKERATASMLAELLRTHPRTREIFKIGAVVGTSQNAKRKRNLGELVEGDMSQDALAMFREGSLDLVVATSVLEEGLDVPGCNLVICFEKPANLKSFVQRRGRARHQDSKLVLLLDSRDQKLQEWAQLEADMKAIYEDDMRILEEMLVDEDAEEHDGRTFRVERTNAMLDLDSAMAHLHHYCAVLPRKAYVDLRPDFICTSEGKLVRAKVILPTSVHQTVRVAESRRAWISEKNAIKDAAFQAYVALYNAELVNDNLLPLIKRDEVIDELMTSSVETRASLMQVSQQLNPWIDVAAAWKAGEEMSSCRITLGGLEVQMHLPVIIPHVRPFKLYWDTTTELVVIPGEISAIGIGLSAISAHDTWALLQAAFGSRFVVEQEDIAMQFSINYSLPLPSLLGRKSATGNEKLSSTSGLLRESGVGYMFQQLLPSKPPAQDVQQLYIDYDQVTTDTPHFAVKRLPKRLDFLHKLPPNDKPASTKLYSTVLPVSRCTIDDMPFPLLQLGLMIPSIIHRYEIYLVAQTLTNTLLSPLTITDLSLIVTAICASSANEETNYQRLEFLGDSILKMCTSVQLMALYPLWHEGYLSFKKDRLVANSRLARAAMEIGLDKFIITKSFTGLKWRPPYISSLLSKSQSATETPEEEKRQMSSKVLADVVEALIGASMLSGGLSSALACLQIFLPEVAWLPLSQRRQFLYDLAPSSDEVPLPYTLLPLETLIGYTFSKKALLTEAFTHASYTSGSSLERFEFLGDSILDYLIVTEMYKHNLSHVQMHLLRTALVNADFLAFVCMEWHTSLSTIELNTPSNPKAPITSTAIETLLPLWRFMRHTSPSLAAVQRITVERHASLREEISAAIERGTQYPWALLARMEAQKFYSDMVESLLGAVWIDSGSFETCRAMLGRMGVLKYMERILNEGVRVWHPKEEVGFLAGNETVRYVLEKETNGASKKGQYLCTLFVGEEEIVKVNGGVNKEEVKTRAAEQAVRILSSRKEWVFEKGVMRAGVVEGEGGGGVDLMMCD